MGLGTAGPCQRYTAGGQSDSDSIRLSRPNANNYLDVEDHSENLIPSLEGHSIGRWDGDSLVIDTIGFLPLAFIPRESVMTSAEMHVVERISFDNESNMLVRDYVVTDPLYLAEPYRGKDIADLAATAYQPFNCVDLSGENNRRPA